jgi:hypothetical protein
MRLPTVTEKYESSASMFSTSVFLIIPITFLTIAGLSEYLPEHPQQQRLALPEYTRDTCEGSKVLKRLFSFAFNIIPISRKIVYVATQTITRLFSDDRFDSCQRIIVNELRLSLIVLWIY